MLGNMLSTLWNLALTIMKIEIPVAQYKITMWQLFLFTSIMGLVLKFVFGVSMRGGGDKKDYD